MASIAFRLMSNTCTENYIIPKSLKIAADLLDGLSEAVEVVLNETLSLKDVFPEETDQCQEPVDLSQVENGAVVQTNDGR